MFSFVYVCPGHSFFPLIVIPKYLHSLTRGIFKSPKITSGFSNLIVLDLKHSENDLLPLKCSECCSA